jgi:hypothetical protein
MKKWLAKWNESVPAKLSDTSFDIFTYHGEDGILQYLISRLPGIPQTFADIGSGDCIKSNCAALAIHYGWEGLFADRNEQQLAIGKKFYKPQKKNGQHLEFVCSEVKPASVNKLLTDSGLTGTIGLLSVDIDGNDFWIWKAIDTIQPEIVCIEAKVELGDSSLAVPYSETNHHHADVMYNGASVAAFCKLATQKGYKLAGANKQGYNLFFVKKTSDIPEVKPEEIVNDPDIRASFYPEHFFTSHRFEVI